MAQFQTTGGKEKLFITDIKVNKLSTYKNIICNPPDDKNKRFLLGKNGSKEKINPIKGLHPSMPVKP